ncbi:predicted protein [Postia placenta Mad-698-R]|uniref:CCHC-type domain-containing protein n=1 Tax=Postia placenta MAD-698-R-SB12 TaxID=670580 RepID=A0A1X6MMR7_9APHY|nr:hypothetical protein POSPLADRAFT_1156068 [Postia placenta MAD-698-R-SB12]EED79847.1 predicted protein [Postia placenta Mad-698-R]OSX57704.1 hypothetical protein POSPLADRAFT_1156068 [Postia placenta MAD-698-R-SB12]
MSSTLLFLDQFNAPSTEGGKRISIYTPKHTHVGDSTLLMLLLSNPTDVFNKLKTHHPEATNATDCAALEVYLSTRREYDEAVKAADEAIDHHKRLLRQQDDRVLTELIRLDNLKVAHRFQPLLPRSIQAQHNKFIPRAIPNAYLPLPAPLPTSTFRHPPISSPFLQATPQSTTIPADWQPNPGWTPKGSCRRCRSSRHWVRDCPDIRCTRCGKEAPGHLERECGTRPMKRHVSTPPEEPARCVGVVVNNVFLEGIINEAKERKERERQTKVVPIPPPCSANPEPQASPIAGSSHPRPDTPVVFRKVDPDWTPDTTPWTWDSSWPRQKHLSGEEWKNVGRNVHNEWFNKEEDDGIDWELYGDGEQRRARAYGQHKVRMDPIIRKPQYGARVGACKTEGAGRKTYRDGGRTGTRVFCYTKGSMRAKQNVAWHTDQEETNGKHTGILDNAGLEFQQFPLNFGACEDSVVLEQGCEQHGGPPAPGYSRARAFELVPDHAGRRVSTHGWGDDVGQLLMNTRRLKYLPMTEIEVSPAWGDISGV